MCHNEKHQLTVTQQYSDLIGCAECQKCWYTVRQDFFSLFVSLLLSVFVHFRQTVKPMQAYERIQGLFLYDNIVVPVGGNKCLFSETLNYSLNWFIQEQSKWLFSWVCHWIIHWTETHWFIKEQNKWRRYNWVIKSFTELIHSNTLIQSAMKQVFKSELVNSSLLKNGFCMLLGNAMVDSLTILNYFGGAKTDKGTCNIVFKM